MRRLIRILGIDPGLRRTGWGLVESDGNRLIYSFWPIVDLLDPPVDPSAPITGRGTVFGWTFCRFRLEPR